MSGVVVLYDFDETIVGVDTDYWLIELFGFTHSAGQLRPNMPWNSIIDRMLKEIQDHGKTIDDIVGALTRIPVLPRIVSSIKCAHDLGCELRIVSDSNVFFIERVLENLGVRKYFSEINTNSGFLDDQGRVRVAPYHDFTKASHGCALCPPNMCKGLIVERIQASIAKEEEANSSKRRIIYVGDGVGDYCPSLKLKESDFLFPRKNFKLWDLINRNPLKIKAQIHEWTSDEGDQELDIVGIVQKIQTAV